MMNKSEQRGEVNATPLVTVITPFYNTQQYLRECIESVLNQKYENFEYILHDNASDDGSSEIALEFLNKDTRIKYFKTNELLGQVENYNRAVSLACESSKYIKIVQADDWIAPDYLEKTLALAEKNSKVGLISTYYYKGVDVFGSGLEYFQDVVPGSYACELQLRKGYFMFGSPTSVLYRKEAVKDRSDLYEVGLKHEDTELAYEILKNWEFGFVHEILSYLRLDEGSISGQVKDLNSQALDKFIIVNKFAPTYIQQNCEGFMNSARIRYYSDLANGAISSDGVKFLRYHLDGLRSAGIEFDKKPFLKACTWVVVDLLLNPKKTVGRIYRALKRNF